MVKGSVKVGKILFSIRMIIPMIQHHDDHSHDQHHDENSHDQHHDDQSHDLRRGRDAFSDWQHFLSKFKFQLFARGRKNGIDIGKYHWPHIFIYLDRGFPIWYSINFHRNPLETKLCVSLSTQDCFKAVAHQSFASFFLLSYPTLYMLLSTFLTYDWVTIKDCCVPVAFWKVKVQWRRYKYEIVVLIHRCVGSCDDII